MEKEKEQEPKSWITTGSTHRQSWCPQKKPCKFCLDYMHVTVRVGGGMKQSCEARPKELKVARPGGLKPDSELSRRRRSKKRTLKNSQQEDGSEKDWSEEDASEGKRS